MNYTIISVVTNNEGTRSRYNYDISSFSNALVKYDKEQSTYTGNATYASYWIKLIDAKTGEVIKHEERDLVAIRGEESAEVTG